MFAVGDVDRLFPLLLRRVHFIERSSAHQRGGCTFLNCTCVLAQAESVELAELFAAGRRVSALDLLPADREDFIDRAVEDRILDDDIPHAIEPQQSRICSGQPISGP